MAASGEAPELRHRVLLGGGPAPAGYLSWAALCAGGAADGALGAALAAREAELHPDEPINIQYTSGVGGAALGGGGDNADCAAWRLQQFPAGRHGQHWSSGS